MDFVLTELCQQVMTARGAERPLHIRGGGTKRFYGEPVDQDSVHDTAVLDLSGYHGVVNYQPSELVITAKAGTLLSEVEALLAERNQMLAFEPPRFGAASTLGGCIAAGLSGPRRMAAGSARDYVLGAKLLDSSGSVLSFGGEVMKNVAGFDISRLLAGSLGILGPMVEVSVKVAPRPFEESTAVLDLAQAEALKKFTQWRGLPLPVSGTVWHPEGGGPAGRLYVRVSGSGPAVDYGLKRIGGELMDPAEADAFWASIRDHTHPFFAARPLWRVALPPNAGPLEHPQTLVEWNGGQRWIAGVSDPLELRSAVAGLGGHATLFRHGPGKPEVPVFHPLPPGVSNINRRLKQELDPMGIFNPNRMFPDF
ncbi:glycolate oxidase subunit GlcE [Parapusillimonas granuli]|uniref:Glycolate oxidase subunit GlcE n=1 Tax=Parapusillimonas granuli TaxID=380911 RepID=A0A853G660_9BURK|nr:glycolate oxidase subunit GlcE [Parapusillimonas granuli]MBB5217432.1 glycolate oxidase FAD binding subunit [Parapusillimonas granuli]MEB2401904.1 glycolate oxidase subunit GlcE [Alcaligenaceae bacterium]NYT50076.1 glycolate oxidase subunit GlcE [Parapusillimonas granuli]